MQKSTVRRGAIAGGFAGVALIAALMVPAAANAAEPEVNSGVAQVTQPGAAVQLDPGQYLPGDPSQTVTVTQDRDGNVTVLQPGQLPPGAVLATPMPGDQPRVTLVPRDSIPAQPTYPAPSTGSAG
ncbi:MAG: hypothetical protein JWN03_2856 [Nocardia sp.]|uniref:hypothetical protein n=1 Tax=Nocardia sp. TaxID=1821 RepID=UPI002618FD68|nr:hypothetical protein [Nocardia sp.]MCU1642581.1 hypothetical protein [Nocardia sp.]